MFQAITFDTGGTVLDWHSGIRDAFAAAGRRHGVSRDWAAITNQYRREAMKGIVGQVRPAFNMDDVHFNVLASVFQANGLVFTSEDRAAIARTWHSLRAWQDFMPALARIRGIVPVISFTMLPLSLVVDVSRLNGLVWDAVISCEAIGYYKPDPRAYKQAAKWLAAEPKDILMVACHNFDLNAARSGGFKTAFVRRPDEWGPEGPPDPVPHPACDHVFDDFNGLAQAIELLSH
jgi:2-haloacid dehalogenase